MQFDLSVPFTKEDGFVEADSNDPKERPPRGVPLIIHQRRDI